MADTNVASPELAGVEIHGSTRSAFIAKGALAASAVYGLGTVSPFVSRALAQGGGGDVEVLNFALTLEYLEAAFYERATKQAKLSGKVKSLVEKFGEEESAHVKALTQAIKGAGGKPVSAPKVTFPFKDEKSFLKLAVTFEDTGVGAYNGAAPMIKSAKVLGAAGSIVQVEARHAAAVRLAAGQAPAPDAFDKTLEKQQVLQAVKPFLK
jgi:rubrerythrin